MGSSGVGPLAPELLVSFHAPGYFVSLAKSETGLSSVSDD